MNSSFHVQNENRYSLGKQTYNQNLSNIFDEVKLQPSNEYYSS